MAKILIAGNACVVTSDFTMEQLRRLKKYSADSLVLRKDDKKDGDPIFMLDVGSKGCVSAAGIVFDGETHDDKKLACLTMNIPAGTSDVNKWVMDNIGSAIIKLRQLEGKLTGALKSVDDEEKAILASVKTVEA